jgi:hypothetical protein
MTRPRHRRADDRGSLAAVELPFATLWIAAVALVVLTFPTWNERADAARAAADGAARAVATADTWELGRRRDGRQLRPRTWGPHARAGRSAGAGGRGDCSGDVRRARS